jgi:hypothetical protein
MKPNMASTPFEEASEICNLVVGNRLLDLE